MMLVKVNVSAGVLSGIASPDLTDAELQGFRSVVC